MGKHPGFAVWVRFTEKGADSDGLKLYIIYIL